MDYPKLRPVEALPVRRGRRVLVHLHDPAQLTDKVAVVPAEMMALLVMFDGRNSIGDIQVALTRHYGELVLREQIEEVVRQLDEAFLLDSDRFQAHVRELREAFRESPARRACNAGLGYPADPEELGALLDGFFVAEGGPGRPAPGTGDGRLVGLVAPHIDFERGALSYAHAYKPLAEACDADLFVIFGTAHVSNGAPYILTRKSFETPLGLLRTSEELVDRLAARCGEALFDQELIHRSEHSIEFQVLLIQHLLKGRAIEMLPILCGAMEPTVGNERPPSEVSEIRDFLAAVRDVVEESGRRACFIAGADLAHVGRQFGDDFPLSPQLMRDVERADRGTIDYVLRLDADGFYDNVRSDDNARHICGVPPIYALLATADATRCELLDYRQATDYDQQRSVTFASLALYE